ncbi:uncharacterized protein MELLADRAFT_64214 [Melampsora larici-populina 98AG31]|uniref:Uncharacterized protein n=1 Tax=Melampsora larici-populina (strain 98AG31 / pathotype 3-4-7) TaxID=747676 RepID=F4RQF3_MELLP|nr:uncharacterized protein MELLADRAFT_64214 [Melampsora larici-populina 98AG31]EGG05398.1 hypothetical protein MELLADRAFT_64214 [Melampsora larici-populina 98AG31]
MEPGVQTADSRPLPNTVNRTILVLRYMAELDIAPKQFMVTFMSSMEPEIKYCRRLMRTGLGIEQTRSIINNFGKHTKSCEEGRAAWEELILDQASDIVNHQGLPRGHFPTGAYVSSNRITADFFSESSETLREEQVKKGMSFLYSLIHQKVQTDLNHPPEGEQDDEADEDNSFTDCASNTAMASVDGSPTVDGDLDEDTVMSMENLVFVKPLDKDQARHKLAKVQAPRFLINQMYSS